MVITMSSDRYVPFSALNVSSCSRRGDESQRDDDQLDDAWEGGVGSDLESLVLVGISYVPDLLQELISATDDGQKTGRESGDWGRTLLEDITCL